MDHSAKTPAAPPRSPPRPAPIDSTEAFFRHQLDAANKEKAQLQQRLRQVEDHNKALLKSLYELSCAPAGAPASRALPLDITTALRRMSSSPPPPLTSSPSPAVVSGKGSAYRRTGLSNHWPQPPAGAPATTPFRHQADLRGHASAVYSVQFSPDGQLLVSVSFDRSLRVWRVEGGEPEAVAVVADAHRAPAVAVEWAEAGRVVSGGLDQTVAAWDLRAMAPEPVARFPCTGLVNCVSVSPAQAHLLFVGTARGAIHAFDSRSPPPPQPHKRPAAADDGHAPTSPAMARNDAGVNTIHVTLDGNRIISGDHAGAVKTWDMRCAAADPVSQRYNEPTRRPITHIHASPPLPGEGFGRLMAVNSYDTYLRVYDRDSFLFRNDAAHPTHPPRHRTLHPIHALRGVANAHWPIKSSFFVGADYTPPARRTPNTMLLGKDGRAKRKRSDWAARANEKALRDAPGSPKTDATLHPFDAPRANPSSTVDEDDEDDDDDDDEDIDKDDDDDDDEDDEDLLDERRSRPSGMRQKSDEDDDDDDDADDRGVGGAIQSALILASGSADGQVYIFDVGGRSGRGGLLQTLEGHKHRVYTVDFHPYFPLLASCSADSDIKLWHAR